MTPFMLRLRRSLWVLLIGFTAAYAAGQDSLQAQMYASVSVRNPRITERVVVRADGVRDTLKNPFDYELATGITGSYSTIVFTMDYQYERQDGLNYVNQEYSVRQRARAYEIGARLRDSEEDRLYVLSAYIEAKLFGWVGLGITRQHFAAWFGDAATMARFSLARNRFHIMHLDLTVQAEYEINPTRSRIFLYTDIRNFQFGRVALVPFYRLERIAPKGGTTRSSYQGKVKLTIRI